MNMSVKNNQLDDDTSMDLDDHQVVVAAPALYTRPVYYRQHRRSKRVFKTVLERYLRDDLGFGCHYVAEVARSRSDVDKVHGKPQVIKSAAQLVSLLQPPASSLVVCDANVLLHNMDVLEQAKAYMPNIVIPQTALEECRKNRMVSYDRTVDLLRTIDPQTCLIFFPDPHHAETASNAKEATSTTPNDANDARLRNVADFYGRHLSGSNVDVVFLTDDAASRQLAAEESSSYQALSVREWIQKLQDQHPGLSLLDVVAQTGMHNNDDEDCFDQHVDGNTLSRGVQTGQYYRGVFRSVDLETASITIRRGEERVAVTIQGAADRNRAVDGDVVAVALHPLDKWLRVSATTTSPVEKDEAVGISSETAEPTLAEMNNVPDSMVLEDLVGSVRPTGKIVGILRRTFDNQSGSIYTKVHGAGSDEQERIAAEHEREHADGSTTCVFFPVNRKIPPVLIRTSQRDRLLGQRIVVSIDSWPANSPYPMGHYVRTLGKTGTKDVETQVLLQQHDIPHEPFSAAVLACLPPEDYKISADNSPGRLDLRHLPVLSIDPPGCKDIDDALHCQLLSNGNYQVGVHIADVTRYVKDGTAIDIEAASRSTSTYLVNKRLDMLPGLLTTDLCSLKGNVDRYAFSVLWEVTPEADIVKVEFHKSLIHSIAALTYQQAQSFIDQPDDPDDVQACAVKGLAHLARKFRQRRIDAGALTLASPEVKFVLDSESLNPTDVQAYTLFEANAVVEEFMLLANVTVSKKILRHYPTLSVLRRHPAPNRSMFDGLISKAKSIGLSLNIDDSKKLADSLDAAEVPSDPYVNKLLRILSTRCMSPAQYFCSGEFRPTEWHHYGLAAPVYTHFTSPIRRYADVCVHRLLAASIGVAPLPQRLSSKSYLHDLCANMNRRHRSAQVAGRASVQLHTLIFFSEEGGKLEDAYVLDVNTNETNAPSFTVMVPRYGIEGKVKLPIEADDSHLERFPDEHRITYIRDSKTRSIRVFDKVRVKIWVRETQGAQRELVIDLVEDEDENTKKRRRDEADKERNASSKKKRA